MPVTWPGEGQGDATEMTRFRVILSCLFFFFSLGFLSPAPVWAGEWVVLKGAHTDTILDVEKGRAWFDGAWHGFPDGMKVSGGMIARTDAGWWCWSKKGVQPPSNLTHPVPVPGGLLPTGGTVPGSLHPFLFADRLLLPVADGWVLLDTTGRMRPVPWTWQPSVQGTVQLEIPDLAVVADRVFLLDARGLWTRLPDGWKRIVPIEDRVTMDAMMVIDGETVALVRQLVEPGDIGSFQVWVTAVHARTLARTVDAGWSGIMKVAFSDGAGSVVFEYVKAGLLSALMDRKKMRFRTVDLQTGASRTRKISIGDKRRHVFPVWDRAGRFRLVVQCQSGRVWLVDPMRGKVGRLKQVFSYDYKFVRGVGNGAFVDPKHHRVEPVDFSDFR